MLVLLDPNTFDTRPTRYMIGSGRAVRGATGAKKRPQKLAPTPFWLVLTSLPFTLLHPCRSYFLKPVLEAFSQSCQTLKSLSYGVAVSFAKR